MTDPIPLPLRHRPVGRVALAALAAAGLGLSAAAPALAEDTAPAAAGLPSFAPMVKKVLPAVVNISVNEKAGSVDEDDESGTPGLQGPDQGPVPGFPASPFDQYLKRFFGPMAPQQVPPFANVQRVALGSGFIIDPSGYVVTNNHVVRNADKVTVIFQDGSRHKARIVGRDQTTDLALLKIDAPQPLPYVQWGDSEAAQVGDWVLAVGNPFGLGGSVSSGVISARGRDIQSGPYDNYLQIDAAINRGNSGGPTFDLAGKVIGINTAIYSPNGGSVGIGFAIPSSVAQPIIAQLKAHGAVARSWLGVEIQPVTPEIASSLGLPKPQGALVASVEKGSPAEKAGFRQGDVILSVGDREIARMHDLPIIVADTPAGQTVPMSVWRDHGRITLTPVVARMPASQQLAENGEGGEGAQAAGLSLAPLDGQWRQRLGLPATVDGVVVTNVAPDSPFAAAGVAPGDVIEAINQQSVSSPDQATAKLDGSGKDVLLLIDRHGVTQFVGVELGDGANG